MKAFFRGLANASLGRLTKEQWGSSLLAFFIAGIFLFPILSIIQLIFFPDLTGVYRKSDVENIWMHLLSTILPTYIRNSFILVLLTGSCTFLIGVSTAWFVSHYQFRTRKILNWALVLPFSIPTYIAAYLYSDLLDYSGPVQIFIRSLIGAQGPNDYYFPPVRSLFGAGIIMSLSLYPYVYLLARKSFYEHSFSLSRAQELMGLDNFRGFIKISLPMARPAIAVGVILVILETLNDFGTVEYLAVNTLSLGVYNLWFNLNDLTSATRIAGITLLVIAILIYLEHNSRRTTEQFQREGSTYDPPLKKLSPLSEVLMSIYCWLPIIFGFLVPLTILSIYTVRNASTLLHEQFFTTITNSIMLAFWAATLCTVISVFIAYLERSRQSRLIDGVGHVISLGYAIPGIILALGLLIPLGLFDNWVDARMEALFGIRTGLILSGTGAAIVLAYTIRFSSISIGSARSTLKKISPNIDDAGKLIGYNERQIFFHLHLPLLKKSLLTGFLIIFIDSIKELSATIILRPFDFETLATQIYAFASGELVEEAAPFCLFLVLISLIPTFFLTRSIV